MKAIANVIDMLTGIIGDKESDGKKSSSKTNNNKSKVSRSFLFQAIGIVYVPISCCFLYIFAGKLSMTFV